MKVAAINMPWFSSKIKYLKSEGEVTYRPVLPPTVKNESLKHVEVCPVPSSHAQGQQQQSIMALLPVAWMSAFKSPVWQSVLGAVIHHPPLLGGLSKQSLIFSSTNGGAALKEHWLQGPGSGCVENEPWSKRQLSFCDQTERKLS